MDFFEIGVKAKREKGRPRSDGLETKVVYPIFKIRPARDFMVRGKTFVGIWDEKAGFWSTDEYDVPRIVNDALYAKKDELDQIEDLPGTARTAPCLRARKPLRPCSPSCARSRASPHAHG